MPEYIEPYIKVYEWLLKQPDLTRLDAILISKIMQFPNGCWISSKNLGLICGAHLRSIQKKIAALVKKGWLAKLTDEESNRKYVWATLKEPPIGPLFDYMENAEKQMQKQKARNARFMIQNLSKQLSLW